MSDNKDNMNEKSEKHSDLITGRNAVTEALRSGRPIEALLVARSTDSSGRSFGQIIALAREMNVTVKEVSPAKLDAMCGGSHQGIAALTAVHEYAEIDDIFALAESRGEAPFILLCDGFPCGLMEEFYEESHSHRQAGNRMSRWKDKSN